MSKQKLAAVLPRGLCYSSFRTGILRKNTLARKQQTWRQWHMILWWKNMPSSGSARLCQTVRFFKNASQGRLAADGFVASVQAFCARKQPLESKNDATVWHDSLMNKQHPVQALLGFVRQFVSSRLLRIGAVNHISAPGNVRCKRFSFGCLEESWKSHSGQAAEKQSDFHWLIVMRTCVNIFRKTWTSVY